jgi:phosphate transport system substrate-binding protein
MNHKVKFAFAITSVMAVATTVLAQVNRDSIRIVGSSTVYPLAVAVAEQFSKNAAFKPPQIESIGTGAGFKLFCAGAGPEAPDIVNASRPIKPAEVETCAKNGIKEIAEIKIGYDALVFAYLAKSKPLELTREVLFLALAKNVPDPNGGDKLVPNPHKTWKSIDSKLPDVPIKIWGPDSAHGTYDSLISQVMVPGCKRFNFLKAMEATDPKAFEAACQSFRGDGVYAEAANSDVVLRELKGNPGTVGILDFILLMQNSDLQGAAIDGIEPRTGSVSHNVYPLTRTLYFYVDKAHVNVIPGLMEYVREFTSDQAFGAGSKAYLIEKGLIPMPLAERKQVRAVVDGLKPSPQ